MANDAATITTHHGRPQGSKKRIDDRGGALCASGGGLYMAIVRDQVHTWGDHIDMVRFPQGSLPDLDDRERRDPLQDFGAMGLLIGREMQHHDHRERGIAIEGHQGGEPARRAPMPTTIMGGLCSCNGNGTLAGRSVGCWIPDGMTARYSENADKADKADKADNRGN